MEIKDWLSAILRLTGKKTGHGVIRQKDVDGNLLHRLETANYNGHLKHLVFTVLDLETTGFEPFGGDEIISAGAVKTTCLKIREESFYSLVNPGRPVPHVVSALTGIDDAMVKGSKKALTVLEELRVFLGDSVIVGHYVNFDMTFINRTLLEAGVPRIDNLCLDTAVLGGLLMNYGYTASLDEILKDLAIEPVDRHNSLGDALLTAKVFCRLMDPVLNEGIDSMDSLLHMLRQRKLNEFMRFPGRSGGLTW